MFLFVVSLIVVLPLIELYFIVQVAHGFGILPTIALLIAVSAVGTTLIKREGIKVYRDFIATIDRGEEPSRQVIHGVCLLAAGVLLLAPGFVSDAVALLLLLPPVRSVVVAVVMRGRRSRVTVIRATHSGPIVETRGHLSASSDVIDVAPREGDDRDERNDQH